jgi:hypothetical protein
MYATPEHAAYWHARYPPATWLFVRPSHGKPRWWSLPVEVRDLLAEAWPKAQAEWKAKQAELAAERTKVNESAVTPSE